VRWDEEEREKENQEAFFCKERNPESDDKNDNV
jgi:hypothetical protein